MVKYKAPRGTRDILPGEVERWQQLETRFREYCILYGFSEIRTPIFEHTELFLRSVGEDTDIVSKEMYSFQDRSNRQLTLRPEGTAATVRAYLENNLSGQPQPAKLYYQGPMFRYDRPQAGRYRQFHQFGLELFGAAEAAADAEIIALSHDFIHSLNIKEANLELNSVGCPQCRPAYRDSLLAYLKPLEDEVCPDCRRRFAVNPLRVLDCKDEKCRSLAAGAPALEQFLCRSCSEHFNRLRRLLDRLAIPFTVNPRLVRGLDYYTRTALEFVCPDLGSIAGGGRYDYLVEECGGPPTPAVGVAFGVERLLLAAEEAALQQETVPPVFIATAGENLEEEALALAAQLRGRGIAAETELMGRTLKGQMKLCGRKGYDLVLILGQKELSQNLVALRDMRTGEQIDLPREQLLDRVEQMRKAP
ncbi:MAG TPA: histidine--tRNA ligase [Bacillota bacterium]|nr:histidine--tRNA ligase [Bacillota bacterium]